MAKLISRTEGKAKISIKERYPDQDNALARSGLSMKNFRTLKELWENADEREKNKNVKGRGEGDVTLISALGSHNCGRRKFIV